MNSFFFFFNDTATTEIYTLSLHDALPISVVDKKKAETIIKKYEKALGDHYEYITRVGTDRKSTRLNSSHQIISYAVFCLKKKKKIKVNASEQSPHLHQDVKKPIRLYRGLR